ncbi:glycosyltransferase [Corynebacterium sp.]|uniref:glycosyltransferase n=1 Tax=Corynebacterium sp. TaxID=1720 RepID=UPI0026DD5278|nr:glycosyltransferase [Corynebacterium sp.]MDO5031018.1 glycosyltransferase [Corynebacterium sp.]
MTFTATFSLNYISRDSHRFVNLVARRFDVPLDVLTAPAKSSLLAQCQPAGLERSRNLEKVGEFSQAAEAVKNSIVLKPRRRSLHFRAEHLDHAVDLFRRIELEKAQGSPGPDKTARGGIKVLHLVNNCRPFTTSGYTFRSSKLFEAQAASGMEPCALTRYGYPFSIGKFTRKPKTTVEGVTYFHLTPWLFEEAPFGRQEAMVRAIKQIARIVRPNVIHTTTPFSNGLIAGEAARRLNIPWVYEVRGEPEATWLSKFEPSLYKYAEKSEYFLKAREAEIACMRAADAVISLSETQRNTLVQRGIAKNKITVIPNAIDGGETERTFSQSNLRLELGLPEESKLIGTVTSLVSYEGLDLLLELIARNSKLVGVIVGKGEDLPRLKEIAQELGIADRVFFPGEIANDQVWKWYGAIDVFCIPRIDSWVTRNVTPLKPMQAMALGVPVVASDLPALREVTQEREYYFEPGSIDSFADCVAAALSENPDERNNRREAVKTKTWQKAARKTRVIYESII